MFKIILIGLSILMLLSINCSKKQVIPDPPDPPQNEVDCWLTTGDKVSLLKKQTTVLAFGTEQNTLPNIDVDAATTFQTIDGFGYTLTGSSAMLINNMGITEKNNLLNDLFGNSGIAISYLRVSMGASDLSPTVFSYNDLALGQTDPTLAGFSLSEDLQNLVPVLQQILTINPNIKLMATPWSPPVWMKNNGNSIGGSLLPQYYSVYANYFVKYIQAMRDLGIRIDAVTIQNEPQHGGNNPSMLMTAPEQAEFIKTNLGPAFAAASLNTKIVIWDHNCDNAAYPISILNDADANQYIDGSAFHLYAGDIGALSTVKNAHPDKNLYFTEQWTSSTGAFDGDLKWHLKNVIIGSMRNWSKVALEWNLANDPFYGPHTPGGCTECKGAITINGSGVSKNVGYYIIGHASKFVPAGSVRIASNITTNLQTVAFKTAAGKIVLIVLNDAGTQQSFNIRFNNEWFSTALSAGAVATYIW